jgi:chromosome segregation ATPase
VAATALRAPESEDLEQRLGELVARIDASESQGAEMSSEVTRLAAMLEVERGSLRARLDSLAASQERSSGALAVDELDRRVATLGGRFDALERERDAQAAEIGRMASAFDVERTSFQTQLEALATALSWTSPKVPGEEQLDALTRRLGDLERQTATVASKVSHASTLVPTALRSLEARLDEVAPGPRRPVADRDEPPASPVAPEDDPSDSDDAEPTDDATYRAPTGVVPIRGPNP